ncbi:hypothetical protein GF336_05510 [Candidatus Woesearchaeota archaeon]|nr:hypothetical protein [Candidatus Woesearchaeota archaeon]
MDFFKKLFKGGKKPSEKDLEIPPAPPTKEELPSFPDIPKDISVPSKKEVPVPTVENVEDDAVKEQKKELEEREDLEVKKPIFVGIENYKNMIDEIGLMKNTLKEAEDTIVRVSEFKGDEDKAFDSWQKQIEDIQKKLIYADKTLFK